MPTRREVIKGAMGVAAVVAGSAVTKAFAKGKIMTQEVDAIEPEAVADIPGPDLETKNPQTSRAL